MSIANYLLGASPEWVSAQGARYLNAEVEDVMFVTLGYPGGILAHLHVSWLDPLKTRRVTVVGSRKMLVYDDLDAEARLKIFDKGADRIEPNAYGAWQYRLRDGAMEVPRLEMTEPLATELGHFLECVRRRQAPGHRRLERRAGGRGAARPSTARCGAGRPRPPSSGSARMATVP